VRRVPIVRALALMLISDEKLGLDIPG
jgi:hypothetical protein